MKNLTFEQVINTVCKLNVFMMLLIILLQLIDKIHHQSISLSTVLQCELIIDTNTNMLVS